MYSARVWLTNVSKIVRFINTICKHFAQAVLALGMEVLIPSKEGFPLQ